MKPCFCDFETAKVLTGNVRKYPDLMSQFISNVMCSILYKSIEENVLIEYLPPDRIDELISFAADATNREGIADALLLEGDEGIRVFDAVRMAIQLIQRLGIRMERVCLQEMILCFFFVFTERLVVPW